MLGIDSICSLCYHSSNVRRSRKGGGCTCARKDANTVVLSRSVNSRNLPLLQAVHIHSSLSMPPGFPCFSSVNGIAGKKRLTLGEPLIPTSIWLYPGQDFCCGVATLGKTSPTEYELFSSGFFGMMWSVWLALMPREERVFWGKRL